MKFEYYLLLHSFLKSIIIEKTQLQYKTNVENLFLANIIKKGNENTEKNLS